MNQIFTIEEIKNCLNDIPEISKEDVKKIIKAISTSTSASTHAVKSISKNKSEWIYL